MVRVHLKIGQDNELPVIDDSFYRRDWPIEQRQIIALTEGVKQEILTTGFSEINLLYIKNLDQDDDADGPVIHIFRNGSPEYWEFSDTFVAWEIGNCSSIALEASGGDAEVRLFVAGA